MINYLSIAWTKSETEENYISNGISPAVGCSRLMMMAKISSTTCLFCLFFFWHLSIYKCQRTKQVFQSVKVHDQAEFKPTENLNLVQQTVFVCLVQSIHFAKYKYFNFYQYEINLSILVPNRYQLILPKYGPIFNTCGLNALYYYYDQAIPPYQQSIGSSYSVQFKVETYPRLTSCPSLRTTVSTSDLLVLNITVTLNLIHRYQSFTIE